MFALMQPIVPIAAQAFLDYYFGAVTLSRLEVEALRNNTPLQSTNKREIAEWEDKKKLLGVNTPNGGSVTNGVSEGEKAKD
jgi:thymidylate synthase (FAD)